MLSSDRFGQLTFVVSTHDKAIFEVGAKSIVHSYGHSNIGEWAKANEADFTFVNKILTNIKEIKQIILLNIQRTQWMNSITCSQY